VGGKNASLGEMITNLAQAGVMVPGGFATTAEAYREFLQHEGLADRIDKLLSNLDINDLQKLADTGQTIRQWLLEAPLPEAVHQDIVSAWNEMSKGQPADFSVAVRSSATAEDLPDASFAGSQGRFIDIEFIRVYCALYYTFPKPP
jgi:pyruvate,water dikinase